MPTDKDREYFELEDSKDVEDTEDGGAIVKLDETKPSGTSKFYGNLAETLSPLELNEIANILTDLITKDKDARKKRDEQYEEGIRRTGLGDDAPGGAQFMGASKVVHPMLTEACVDFSARVMKEIFPANGPAKAFIPGDPTDADVERGKRLADFLNYQCIVQISEMRSEMEQMTTQLPLGGGQYVKCTWNERHRRPNVTFVAIDDIYLPYASTNFYMAERKTHVQYVTALEFQRRVDSGMYIDIDKMPDPLEPEMSMSGVASDKVEGREATSYNEDGLRVIYECFCMYEIEDEYGVAPYIVSIDQSTKRILSVYRNWDEDDEKMLELDWMVEFPFVPWRGAYPIGLVHMIGSLSGAATGALRALLDSAHINNFPGLLKLKSSTGGQTERPDPTQVTEIEGSIQDDDVRKLVMPMPFNPPSPVLYELLGFLVDSGKSIIRTTMEEMADTSQDVPVGTTMARLEQGMMVFSAIHGRMHDSMGRLLKVLYRINKFYLEEDDLYDDTGKLLVRRKDFDGPMTVIPVSDPNIFSESQRFAQIQLIAQRAQMLPQLYDLRKVEELILERMKIPQVDELLLPKQEAKEMNAVNENIASSMGRPVVAYPEQEHLSHLSVHLDFITNPMLGMNTMIAPNCLPILLGHIKEHMVLWYATQIFNVATDAAGVDISELQSKSTPEDMRAFDKMLSLASKNVMPLMQPQFQHIPPIVQQAQQLLQQLMPRPPQDPTLELGMAQINMQKEANQMKLQSDQEKTAMQAQIEQLKAQHQKEIEHLKATLKQQELAVKSQTEGQKLLSQKEIEGAKLTEQSRQADQVIQMEAMKQQEENKRTSAKLETDIILAEKKFHQDAQLKQLEASHQANLAQQTHEQTKEQKAMDIHSAHAMEDKKMSHASSLEDKKQQAAHLLEDKKQQSAHILEDKKQQGSLNLEQKKAEGGLVMEGLKHSSAHQLESQRQKHEQDMQRRADSVDLYKEGGKIASAERMQSAEHQHASTEGEKTRAHASQLEEKKSKQAEKLQSKKASDDLQKTKLLESNKGKIADKQLKLKEKEGKEKNKIAQSESKAKLALQKDEHQSMLKFKQQEAKLGLAFKKEEHRSKSSLLKTKTKLTENILKEKAKTSQASTQKKSTKPAKKD